MGPGDTETEGHIFCLRELRVHLGTSMGKQTMTMSARKHVCKTEHFCTFWL